jgi:hypothetical protein
MGEIADDMIQGKACQWCGQYFKKTEKSTRKTEIMTHGYPVVCKECYDIATKKERKNVVRAIYNTL